MMELGSRIRRRLSALRTFGFECRSCHRELAPEEPCFCAASEPLLALDRVLWGTSFVTADGRRVPPERVVIHP